MTAEQLLAKYADGRRQFAEVDLAGAVMIDKTLAGLRVVRSDLEGATLTFSDLRGSTFRSVDMAGADLRGADLGFASRLLSSGFDIHTVTVVGDQ